MIYLVSRNKGLFSPTKYKQVDFEEAMKLLFPLIRVQFDTETTGLDPHTKELLTIQLGCKKFQVVFDWTTLSREEKLKLKWYFESDRVFIGWNLMFDLGFLYVNNIWPKHLWDGMIAEKLIFLGYPPILSVQAYNKLQLSEYTPYVDSITNEIKYYEISYSLRAAAMRRCGINIDKTVRDKIIEEGLTEEGVVYVVCTYKVRTLQKTG